MKQWTYFTGCLACFAFFFLLGRNEPAPSSASMPGADAPEAFHQASDTKTFSSFPAPAIAPNLANPATRKSLESRFSSPYPKATAEYGARDREMISRLGLLKSLARSPDANALPFYRRLLANPRENWVVKRQALQNALALSSSMPEQERDRLIASVPPALLLQAGKTEQELLREYLQHAQR